jgi:ElaA protein
MNWKTLEFEQFTVRELYLIMRARSAVFVVERSHVCLDADGHDEKALHVFAVEDMSRPMPVIAYARIRPGDSEDREVVVDKVLTSPSRRGDGTVEILIERVLNAAAARWPGCVVRVMAPSSQRDFYEQFGFRTTEGPLIEHGIPFIGLTCRTRTNPGLFGNGRKPRHSSSLAGTVDLL